jgi:hypothetical protein
MRRNLINESSLFLLFFISSFAFAATNNHLAELNAKFPFGLLGDDYGVLTVNDLAINACDAVPKPFNADNHYEPYEYWQCFESKAISFDCDSSGIPDENEGVMGLVVVKASTGQERHEYIEHRLWPIKDCRRFLRDAATLLRGSEYACVSGSFNKKALSGARLTSWQFERIKTKKGCEGHDCRFTKKFKQDNCPKNKL